MSAYALRRILVRFADYSWWISYVIKNENKFVCVEGRERERERVSENEKKTDELACMQWIVSKTLYT